MAGVKKIGGNNNMAEVITRPRFNTPNTDKINTKRRLNYLTTMNKVA